MWVGRCFVCIYVCTMCRMKLEEAIESLRNWSSRHLWATMWVIKIEARFLGRGDIPSHWFLSLARRDLLLIWVRGTTNLCRDILGSKNYLLTKECKKHISVKITWLLLNWLVSLASLNCENLLKNTTYEWCIK